MNENEMKKKKTHAVFGGNERGGEEKYQQTT